MFFFFLLFDKVVFWKCVCCLNIKMIEYIFEVREVEKGLIIFISIFKIRVLELWEKLFNNNCNIFDFFCWEWEF